jgi:arylsulfatase A-like enzyme
MNRRLLSLLCLSVGLQSSSVAAEKLNVLFILSDDARPELGCYGAPIQTPHLDKLASQSVRFDRAYCQFPLCNPSRTSLLTGVRPTTSGVMNNGAHFRKNLPNLVTLPQLFKNHGYNAIANGKVFHGGKEDNESWTATFDPKNDGVAYVENSTGKPTTEWKGKVTGQMRTSDRRDILAGNGEGHADFLTADRAVEVIKEAKDQPFFLTCGLLKPHATPAAPQRFYDLYPPEKITLPADFAPFPTPPPGFPKASLNSTNTDLFWNREANEDEAKLMIQAYRASVSWMDWNVGRVMQALDESGLRERTIVIFWGDHGYHLGEKGKWSKHNSLFDQGARVPLLISMPGAAGSGKACPRVVETLDIYPTLASICGLPLPKHLEGRSLQPLLQEPTATWDHPAVTVNHNNDRSIRTERWRYCEWGGPEGGKALIDEQNDPQEIHNVLGQPEHAEVVKRLSEQLQKLSPTKQAVAPKAKPNVLFLAVDDLNHWVGHFGRNKQTKTPHLDRLAKMGVSFTNAHCAAPVCNPSRAALLSGRRPSSTGIYNNGQPFEQAIKAADSLVMQFKNAGYETLGIGKLWHGGLGFPEQWTSIGEKKAGKNRGEGPVEDHGICGIKFGVLKADETALHDTHITDYGITELGKSHTKPFFLTLGFSKPHMPWNLPQKYFDLHPLASIELPPTKEGDLDDLPPAGVKMARAFGDHEKVVESGRWKEAVQAYLAAISYLDEQVGRVLDAYEKSPERANTIICLWGDHGWHLGEKEHWRKFSLWEESTRAPLMWVVPGVTTPGSICTAPVDFMSIYPTLCELSQVAKPAHVDAATLQPLLANPTAKWDGRAVTTYLRNNHSVRTDRWRYIRYADGGEELYDHTNDPYEWTNLASKPEHTDLKKELAAALPTTNAPNAKGK